MLHCYNSGALHVSVLQERNLEAGREKEQTIDSKDNATARGLPGDAEPPVAALKECRKAAQRCTAEVRLPAGGGGGDVRGRGKVLLEEVITSGLERLVGGGIKQKGEKTHGCGLQCGAYWGRGYKRTE
ncbi:hypothetical protein HJG60_008261 [Phyllostomus discolor]|uniref:Uncharacterized protein n=1 Tax=Phyllostomus discolor TaxID=89673 RepID=A0A834DQ68_9CHIR|nr:hypothetical protein HJG60_008261 [Phyllostomus discolor]